MELNTVLYHTELIWTADSTNASLNVQAKEKALAEIKLWSSSL
jgi:hypothetical protein